MRECRFSVSVIDSVNTAIVERESQVFTAERVNPYEGGYPSFHVS